MSLENLLQKYIILCWKSPILGELGGGIEILSSHNVIGKYTSKNTEFKAENPPF